ncbi:hypothetical protein FRB91_011283, partial [Serendipita sp. 411]
TALETAFGGFCPCAQMLEPSWRGSSGDGEGDFVVRDELHEKGAFRLWELFRIT